LAQAPPDGPPDQPQPLPRGAGTIDDMLGAVADQAFKAGALAGQPAGRVQRQRGV